MFQGVHFGGIVVADRAIHETADGRRFLVIHGDQFDTVVHNVRWLAYLGDKAYDLAILDQPAGRARAPAVRPAVLVVLVLGQGEGQEGGELHRRVPGRADRGSPPLGRRRRHLRPHPPCRDRGFRRRRSTSTPATGSKAAPPSSSISTAGWRSLHWPQVRAEPSSFPDSFVPVLIEGRAVEAA